MGRYFLSKRGNEFLNTQEHLNNVAIKIQCTDDELSPDIEKPAASARLYFISH